MPVVLPHNQAPDLNLVEDAGPVSPGELGALAEFQAGNLSPACDATGSAACAQATIFAGVDSAALDALFAH